MKIKHKSLFLVFLVGVASIFFCLPLCSQTLSGAIDLDNLTPIWQSIIGSAAIYEPVETAYGFVMAGQGRTIFACTKKGTPIWQRSLPTPLLKPFSITKDNFIIALIKDYVSPCRLCLVNPTGKILWQKPLPVKITSDITDTDRGRIYLAGEGCLLCLGMNGNIRYIVSCADINPNFAPLELNDGSILVIHKQTKDSKSVATRFDPYGNKIEEIVFAGLLSSAYTCYQGIVFCFQDGSLALLSTKNTQTISVWTLPQVLLGQQSKFIFKSKTQVYVLYGKTGLRVATLDIANGKIINTFSVAELSFDNIIYQKGYTKNIILSSKQRAVIYSQEGKRICCINLFSKAKWSYIFATQQGELAVFSTDWTISSYEIAKLPKEDTFFFDTSTQKKYPPPTVPVALSNDLTGGALTAKTKQQIISAFTNDNTKQDKSILQRQEAVWLFLIAKEIDAIRQSYLFDFSNSKNTNFYITNSSYCNSVFECAGVVGTNDLNAALCLLLSTVKNTDVLVQACNAIKNIAWDPNKELIRTLENIVFDKSHHNDTKLMTAVCDAIFAICDFNGKPPFVLVGKKLLSHLMSGEFNTSINLYAKQTLTKIR